MRYTPEAGMTLPILFTVTSFLDSIALETPDGCQ